MGFLTDTARSSFKKVGGRPYVPEWYKAVWAVGLGLLGVFFLYSLIFGGNDTPPTPGPTQAPVATGSPTRSSTPTTTPTVPISSSAVPVPEESPSEVPTGPDGEGLNGDEGTVPGEGVDEEVLAIPSTGAGGTIVVPVGAYEAARTIGLALFTGDFKNAPLAKGSKAPNVKKNPKATLTGISGVRVEPAVVTFSVAVNLNDAAGTKDEITVDIVREGTKWVYPPTAS